MIIAPFDNHLVTNIPDHPANHQAMLVYSRGVLVVSQGEGNLDKFSAEQIEFISIKENPELRGIFRRDSGWNMDMVRLLLTYNDDGEPLRDSPGVINVGAQG